MSDRSNRAFEILNYLTGYYDVVARDKERGYISFSFWLAKPMGNAQVSTEGLRFQARLGDKARDLFPVRFDVSGDRLGLRLKLDALPKNWVGDCEISFGRSYRCFPFKGISDISASFLPRRASDRPQPQLEASL